MNNKIRFLLFVADELLIAVLAIVLLLYFHVSPMIIVFTFLILIFISLFIVYIFLPQLNKPTTGVEGMVGIKGTSIESLDPFGKVRVRGEIWDAESCNGRIEKGKIVIVEKVQNLHLSVRKNS